MTIKSYINRMKGGDEPQPSHAISWYLWSWIGAFVGIALVGYAQQLIPISATDNLFLIGSFGASAVLIYGAPHVPYAQPRNLVGGHLVSAFTGVCVAQFLNVPLEMQAAIAVSTSVLFMHLTHTVHPPGGASALIAVVGSPQIQALGFGYVLQPVLSGAGLMLVVALLINNLSSDSQRHYPKSWR